MKSETNKFLSKNAKKRTGFISFDLQLDDAFILMRFLDRQVNIQDEITESQTRLVDIIDDLSGNLHSLIMLKTKSFLYNNYNIQAQNLSLEDIEKIEKIEISEENDIIFNDIDDDLEIYKEEIKEKINE